MPPVMERNGDQMELDISSCRGMEFQEVKEKISDLPGRHFDWDRKLWIIPADPSLVDRVLKTIRPECSEDITRWVAESKMTTHDDLLTPVPPDAELMLPWATSRSDWQPEEVNGEPFEGLLWYQRDGVDALLYPKREKGFEQDVVRAILGDDMGLGKTITAIAAVEEWRLRNAVDGYLPDGPKLVTPPASVVGSWARELNRWLEEPNIQLVDGKSPKTRQKQLVEGIDAKAWIVANHEQLRTERKKITLQNGGKRTVEVMKQPLFEETEWYAVIGDEIHKFKNRKALQTRGLWRTRGEIMLGLTGTALMNSPDELWALLRWLYPDQYNSNGTSTHPKMAYWTFYNMYVAHYEDHFKRKIVTGVLNPEALRFAIKEKVWRRTASILGLKGRKRIFYPIELTPYQRKLYDEATVAMWLDVAKAAEEGDSQAKSLLRRLQDGEDIDLSAMLRIPNGASRLVRLQQILESPALVGGDDDSATLDDVVEKVESTEGDQWVVFTKFKETNYLLKARLEKLGLTVEVYNGDVKPEDRTKLEDRFQKGEIDVLVGTIAAMYQGITLTASHLMHWVTRDFVPDINEQGEAREDRLGQQELVRVYIPQAQNTVAADKVQPINRLKEQIVRSVLPKDKIEEVHH